MRFTINGQDRELTEVRTVHELLEQMEIAPGGPGIALALNGQVVPRGEFASTTVREGDRIEIVRAVQGG